MQNALSKKLRTLREARGITQQELADTLNVKRATVSHWEMGRRRVSFADATKLSVTLNVPMEELAIAISSELEIA